MERSSRAKNRRVLGKWIGGVATHMGALSFGLPDSFSTAVVGVSMHFLLS